MLWEQKCACALNSTWLNRLWKQHLIWDQISAVIETLFFPSTWLYHNKPECLYECDWNGARNVAIKQKTKKTFSVKNNKRFYYEDEDFASFATQWFSTLTTIFGLLEGDGGHKITRYIKLYV